MKAPLLGNDSNVVSKVLHYFNISAPACILIYIFLNPFPHVTSLQEISFYLAVFMTLVLISFRYHTISCSTLSLSNPLLFFMLIYMCWAILSIFWSIDKWDSLHYVYSDLIDHIILYFMLLLFFCSKKRLQILIWVIVASTTIFSLWGIVYFYIYLGKPLSARFLTISNAPGTPVNTIAIVSLIATLFSFGFLLRERHIYLKFILFFCWAINFFATLLTYSRGAMIALIIASFVMIISLFYKKIRIIVFMAILLIALTGSFIIGSPTFRNRLSPDVLLNNERLNIWSVSIEMIKERPLHGFGFGLKPFESLWHQYKIKVPAKWKQKVYDHPHNFFLHLTVRLGFVGLITVALMLFFSFKMSLGALRSKSRVIKNYGACLTSALTGILLAGMFSKIGSSRATVLFFTILSMITIVWRFNFEQKGLTPGEPEDSGKKYQ